MFTNGQWKPTLALTELAEVVVTAAMAMIVVKIYRFIVIVWIFSDAL